MNQTRRWEFQQCRLTRRCNEPGYRAPVAIQPKGLAYPSPGQRPGNKANIRIATLKELPTIAAIPQSLSKVYVHIVFSTKNREPWLRPDLRAEVHRYLGGVAGHHDCPALIVGGVEDHVHLLCVLGRTMTQANLLMELKRASSRWIKECFEGMSGFAWQNGYGAFSIGQSQVDDVTRYIEEQESHHQRVSFQDEFRSLLKKYQVEYDERFVWD